jgi:putative CocE/NonD family hydrolase
MTPSRILAAALATAALATVVTTAAQAQTKPALSVGTGDIPATFAEKPPANADYVERDVMIPMRDGVKLYTVIFVPKGAQAAPIVLTRTPYNAAGRSHRMIGARLRDVLPVADTEFVDAGYIRIYQDVRGKYGSEGRYIMTWPLRGPLNAGPVDHATDTWDTIDWLVKNLPESNGKVGMIGSSYEGFTAAVALLDPHPALKAVVPESPMLNVWMGDDWFHYGAFRNSMLGYIQMQTAQKGPGGVTAAFAYDKYDELLRAGSTGDYIRAHGLEGLPWVARLLEHPAYDPYWQAQAIDELIAAKPSNVAALWEQGLWDQEDMWGANQMWRKLRAIGHEGNNWLVLGPWGHSQVNRDGYALGPLTWEGDTAKQYRRDMVIPFFEQYLRGGPPANLARVTVYNTADKHWDRLDDWPTPDRNGTGMTPLYLKEGFGLSFAPPASVKASDSYVSDPAKPVPFMERPVLDPFYGYGSTGQGYKPWSKWLVADQRFVDSRPDVLTYETPVLDKSVHVRGVPLADLFAATTGSDGDFVVKLIDVYPANYPDDPAMSGYELAVSLDIFRGRYRESFAKPGAIPANKAQRYRFELPGVDHVFKPGHRMMIQIQSTLFPLYDRNPQTFVPNIFDAKAGDYRKATISILRGKDQATAVWLPVVPDGAPK